MSLTHGRVVKIDGEQRPLARAQAHAPIAKVIPAEVVDAALQAKQLIDGAKSRILDQTAEFERSLELKRAELLRDLRAEAELSLVAKFIEQNALRQRSLEQSRDDIVQLARLLAERVLREQLALDPERFVSLAKKVIAEARGAARVVIHAHPDDASVLQAQLEDLAALATLELHVEPDSGLLRGDLHLESNVGTLDARLGTQLANLAETIRESLRV